MKKRAAQAMIVVGVALFATGLYFVDAIFKITYEVNSQMNAPNQVALFSNIPYCDCTIYHGLGWNIVAATFISLGLILAGTGVVRYKVVTRAA